METITIAAIASTLVFKALEKSGEKLGEVLANKIGQLISIIREKFKTKGIEGILTQAQESPTEANKQMFQKILEIQVSQDDLFAEELSFLIGDLRSNSQVNQIFLKGINISGSAEIGNVNQASESGGSVNQEAATDLRIGGDLKIGDIKQQN